MMNRRLTRRTWLATTSGLTAAMWAHPALAGTAPAPPSRARPRDDTLPSWSLRTAMERAGACCLAWLNPEHHHLPTGGYEIAHDTGRWWDAMLRYAAATGFTIPEAAERAMRENLRALTDNSAGLLTNDARAEQAGGVRQVNPHNFRESMLAYSALVKWRDDPWSRQSGQKLVVTTDRLLAPDGQLDYAGLADLLQLPLTQDPSMIQRSDAGEWFDATGNTGRALEGFVWFHDVTGSPPALELAGKLAAAHLRHVTRPDGRIPPALLAPTNVGHNHSYLGTLRGLLRYGLASGQPEYVEAVTQTYRHGLFGSVISHSGWTPHDLGRSRFPNEHGDPVGEHASCADVIQLALWLATEARERLLRARILPSQIDDPSQPRQHGGWGAYGHPFGRGCILDVFAAVLSVLTEVYQSAVTGAPAGPVCVNLHFPISSPLAAVEAQRGEHGCTRVLLATPAELRIRLPGWSPRAQARLLVGNQPLDVQWDGAYAVVPAAAVPTGTAIELRYDLPARETTERLPVSGQEYRLSWRGDEVVACDPPAPIYPQQ